MAIKAVSHKLARASYYVMRDKVDYDQARFRVTNDREEVNQNRFVGP